MSELIWRDDGATQADITLPHGELTNLGNALTVSAWVHNSASQAEAMQPLVSKWKPHCSFDAFSAFDAGTTDGLSTKGFYGAVFDGQYIYFCPIRSREERSSVHGCVLRYNTHLDFHDRGAYAAYDAGQTDGLHTAGFYGGAFDGRYIYFIPRDDGRVHHSRFLRYDTRAEFKSPASWAAFDADHAHSFQGAAFDGRYIYCCPGYANPTPGAPFSDAAESGVVMRLDTAGEFRDPATYRTFDTQSLDPRAVCFDGAAFDGRYVYFVPLHANTALCYDTQADFDDAESWQVYDAGSAVGMGPSVGAVYDGQFLYFVPFGHGKVVRYDTRGTFTGRAHWSVHDAATTPGLEAAGFKGGFFDGRYVYFVPFRGDVPVDSDKSPFHGTYLRYDTALPFTGSHSWTTRDAGFTGGLHTTAFTAGATDGRYLYAAPWRGDKDSGHMHGRILRYDTVGNNGSFSLRYCDYGHNGGLCAAVPGASFIINTSAGPFGVSAHSVAEPGWHHIAGVYDGRSIKLFVDGRSVGERAAEGTIQQNDIEITIGHIAGAARFRGAIREVRISAVARNEQWVRCCYETLAESKG